MSKYQPRIKRQGDCFYAYIVYVDKWGHETICHDFEGRFFASVINAARATTKYINNTLK